jgi:hypothetical protein
MRSFSETGIVNAVAVASVFNVSPILVHYNWLKRRLKGLDAKAFYDFLVYIGGYVRSVWNKGPGVIRSESRVSDPAFGDSFGWLQIWEE